MLTAWIALYGLAMALGMLVLAALFGVIALGCGVCALSVRSRAQPGTRPHARWVRRMWLSAVLAFVSFAALSIGDDWTTEFKRRADDTAPVWTPLIALAGTVAVYFVGRDAQRRSRLSNP